MEPGLGKPSSVLVPGKFRVLGKTQPLLSNTELKTKQTIAKRNLVFICILLLSVR
jgi:hypothetical protein